jgi:two-component sensor histidine kinase
MTRVSPKLLLNKIDISRDGKIESFDPRQIDSIQLTHKDYYIQFDFSVLDFLDPEKNQYRYMLEGFDHDWIENGTRNSATYTSLPPGDYTLRVQGANSAGVWNREGLSLGIEVLPPPWLSWWAYTIYALVSMFLGWLGVRAYNSYVVERLARRLAAEMVESQQRADDEMQEQFEIHDDLVKSVYQHSISTLNLVSEFIATRGSNLSDETARESTLANINRVEALALLEQCLYYQNEVLLADLNKYTNMITSRLLKDAPGGQESIATINEVSSQPLPIEQASPLAIAIFELVENAIQHAFDSAAGANYIQVTLAPLSSNASDYRLTVQDNGAGIPSNIDPLCAHTSGLAIVAAMSHRLGGELSVSAVSGTLVSITFPGAPPASAAFSADQA